MPRKARHTDQRGDPPPPRRRPGWASRLVADPTTVPAPRIEHPRWRQPRLRYAEAPLPEGFDFRDHAARVEVFGRLYVTSVTGTTADYQQALLDSWEVFNKLFASVSAYTEWYEEAEFEGWAIPASYDRLQKMLNKWDPLRGKVKKLKPMDRRR